MMEEFRLRKVKKSYIAVAQGNVSAASGEITKSIYNRNKKRSEPAITKYGVLQRRADLTVLEVEPVTAGQTRYASTCKE